MKTQLQTKSSIFTKWHQSKMLLSAFILAALFFLTAGTLHATTITSAATGNWSTGSTWVGGTAPIAGDDVIIASGHTVTLTAAVNITTGNLTVTGTLALAGFNLTAGSLSGAGTIGNSTSGNALSGTPMLTVGSNGSNTIFSGILTYNGGYIGLTKVGTGTLSLTGDNYYTYFVTVSAGTLSIGAGGTTGNLNPQAQVTVTNPGTLTFNRSNDCYFAGRISGTGAVTQSGSGNLDFTSYGYPGSGDNSYTGGTTIAAGTLTLASGAVIVGNVLNNGKLTFSGSGSSSTYTFNGIISGTGSVDLMYGYSKTLILTGANTYLGPTTIKSGTLKLGANNVLPDVSDIIFNSLFSSSNPTLETGGFNETVGKLIITGGPSATATIKLGAGNHSLNFANSSTNSYPTDALLSVTGWTGTGGSSGTGGKIFFGGPTGLTATQLFQTQFNGFLGTPILLGSGELVPPVPPPAYTWIATSGSADWQVPGSWTPARTTPSVSDVLQFSNGGTSTATNVPTQTISQLIMSGNTAVTLEAASSAGHTLTIYGSTGLDLVIPGGSAFTLGSGSNAMSMDFSGTPDIRTKIRGTFTVTNGNPLNTLNTTNAKFSVVGNKNAPPYGNLFMGGTLIGDVEVSNETWDNTATESNAYITFNNLHDYVYNGKIIGFTCCTGVSGFTKSGSGKLTFAQPQTHGLSVTINGGTLSINNPAYGANWNGITEIDLLNGATWEFTEDIGIGKNIKLGTGGGQIKVSPGKTMTMSTTTFIGTSSMTKTGLGTLTLGGSATSFPNSTTHTGATIISEGTLQLGNGTSGNGYQNTTAALSVSSAITNNANLVFNRSNTCTQGVDFANSITGTGNVSHIGTGTLVLTSGNSYSGTTTISDVSGYNSTTLRLGAANAVPDASNVILGGGTFSTGATTGFNETAGTLRLSANSAIALGTGSHSLNFANSSAESWTAGNTLTITGWTGTAGASGTAGKIFAGTNATGLTAAQLAQINFSGYAPGASILSTGEVVPFSLCASGQVHNINTGLNYCTIQAAINDVLTVNGHTIKVDAGTYPESLDLTKSLTILGPNSAITPNTPGNPLVINPARVPEAILASPVTQGIAIRSTASGSTISGFTFTNTTTTPSEGFIRSGYGDLLGSSNITISNNYFDGVKAGNGGNSGAAINVISFQASSGWNINNNRIINVTANSGSVAYGMLLWGFGPAGSLSNYSVTDNVVTNPNLHGIQLLKATGFTISGNTIGNFSAAASTNNAAIYIADDVTNTTISGNTITAAPIGLAIFNDGNSSNVSFSNNLITNCTAAGIQLRVGGSPNAVPAGVSFSKNSVDASNASGVQNDWPQAGTVNMTCNWWGNASGLGGAGSSTLTGAGTTTLTTIPGLNSGTDAQPATTGFQTNEVCPPILSCASGPVHNINTGLNYCTIQAAINDVLTVNGHTIKVDAGTYPESLDLTKSLTILGPNSAITPNTPGNPLVINPARVPEAILASPKTQGIAIRSTASGSTISGFTFTNTTTTPSEGFIRSGYGDLLGSSNITISNNHFDGVKAGNGSNSGAAINVISYQASSGWNINNNRIINVTANSGSVAYGMLLWGFGPAGSLSNYSVTDNVITNPNYHGIQLLKATGFTISGNTIGNFSAAASTNNAAIYIADDVTNTTISGNTITAAPIGLAIFNDGNSSNVSFSNNLITNCTAAGIQLRVGGSPNAVPAGVSFSKNSVDASNASGVQNDWPQLGTVDMTCNWWGNASGLGGAGSSTITGPGTTALITIPGLNSGTDTQPATTGFQTNEVCPPVILPVNITMVSATVVQGNVKVSWNSATEDGLKHYEVEHSINGTEFGKSVKVDAKNTSPAAYEWLHVQPGTGDHFYRVRAFNLEGRSLVTKVVKVTLGDKAPGFKAFPTIVSSTRQITLQLISLDKGRYTLQVTDMAGRVISARTIDHNGGSASMIMQMPPALSAGKYIIRLTGTSGNFVQPMVKD
jgi:autotransporter-associated beta strand protein